jgi:hypothetical protein
MALDPWTDGWISLSVYAPASGGGGLVVLDRRISHSDPSCCVCLDQTHQSPSPNTWPSRLVGNLVSPPSFSDARPGVPRE